MRVSADSTVWVAMTSSAATSRLVSPRATRLAMRRSAGLRIWSVGLRCRRWLVRPLHVIDPDQRGAMVFRIHAGSMAPALAGAAMDPGFHTRFPRWVAGSIARVRPCDAVGSRIHRRSRLDTGRRALRGRCGLGADAGHRAGRGARRDGSGGHFAFADRWRCPAGQRLPRFVLRGNSV